MAMQFTVLASGSGGNASLLEADGFGVLIDIGLGPRQLAGRLAAAGASWHKVQAVVLTHLHGDHWKEPSFRHLLRLRIPLYCHEQHLEALPGYSASFRLLCMEGLARAYAPGQEARLAPGLRCRPFDVSHDGGATCGFRFEGVRDIFGHAFAVGYAADLGTWGQEHVEHLSNVDVLALEFNHDVVMEKRSGRSPRLIARVLGDEGHLSNAQAAALLRQVMARSDYGRPRQLIQLHLSRDCNHPRIAAEEARAILGEQAGAVGVHTACQHVPTPTFRLGDKMARIRQKARGMPRRRRAVGSCQPMLLGVDW